MQFDQVVRSRRMVRSFSTDPVPDDVVDDLFDLATWAPTAGNARGVAWVVLRGPVETSRYWEATTDQAWRERSARWPGLSRAPVVGVALCSSQRYLDRYSQPDKAPGLGHLEGEGWPVPFWYVDAGFSTMVVLLGAVEHGLGACFLGSFRGEDELLSTLGVPSGWRSLGAVALGYPDGLDHRSTSLDRPSSRGAALHQGRWQAS